MDISQAEIDEVVRRALLEDLGAGDITTETLVPPDLHGTARIIAKAEGILAGVEIARTVFLAVDPTLDFKPILSDGAGLRVTDHSDENDLIAELSGSVASVLKGERVALNFLQHLSGIATETNRYVREVADYDTVILDTRKTAPGLRCLQKYAVAVGGGTNHRRDLSDGVLIKDNHIAAGRLNELSLGGVVRRMRDAAPSAWEIEVEVENLQQLREAVEAGSGHRDAGQHDPVGDGGGGQDRRWASADRGVGRDHAGERPRGCRDRGGQDFGRSADPLRHGDRSQPRTARHGVGNSRRSPETIGIQRRGRRDRRVGFWIPAFAGTTT